MKTLLITALLVCASGAFAQDGDSYGLERGSVGGFIGGGPWINAGAHPSVTGSFDVGLARYVGLYAEAGGGAAYSALYKTGFAGAGVMATINNHSRLIPFVKVGPAFERGSWTGYRGANFGILHCTAGFDTYVTRHFGAEAQVRVAALPFANRVVVGGPATTISFGVFYRTK